MTATPREVELPTGLTPGRRTPTFDRSSLPAGLTRAHKTSVWAELIVLAGTVRFQEEEGATLRDLELGPGERAVIVPDIAHRVTLGEGARMAVQFYDRE